ncbi:hypothetical protein BOVATA_046460 [Babesia ovata]|uniref:Uncharacterized protein n=1 Tax=Babesia ovata TaxID=189622 RepID=A0A2H6KJH5_9APIC|nr:uncharacterized protein BOVATA_046460 [Babesia ovata]GBE63153.1 hypothetical protein BOVATA_046460 [Babesia ovata]
MLPNFLIKLRNLTITAGRRPYGRLPFFIFLLIKAINFCCNFINFIKLILKFIKMFITEFLTITITLPISTRCFQKLFKLIYITVQTIYKCILNFLTPTNKSRELSSKLTKRDTTFSKILLGCIPFRLRAMYFGVMAIILGLRVKEAVREVGRQGEGGEGAKEDDGGRRWDERGDKGGEGERWKMRVLVKDADGGGEGGGEGGGSGATSERGGK